MNLAKFLEDQLGDKRVMLRPLSEVCTFGKGSWIKAEKLSPGSIPVITSARTVNNFHNESNRTGETVVIASSGAYAGFVSYWREPIWISNAFSVDVISGDVLLPRFLYYSLLNIQQRIHSLASEGGVPNVYPADLEKINIPVPSLDLQHEIVRILDSFTQLEAELEAELEARKKQYEFYRDQLLTFPEEGGVRWVPMGEIATLVRGASPRPIGKYVTDDPDGVPWIKIGDVPAGGKYIESTAQRVSLAGAAKSRRIFPGDFVLSNSMSFGRPYISAIEGCIHDGWLAISNFETSFDPDFFYYLLRSSVIQGEFAQRVGTSSVSNLNSEIVKSVKVPLVPMDSQREIAEILGNFDKLVNDMTVGLPAEIEARRKQYEYYRDKLLTFPEVPA